LPNNQVVILERKKSFCPYTGFVQAITNRFLGNVEEIIESSGAIISTGSTIISVNYHEQLLK